MNKADLQFRLALMAALAIPIFLETLDYTVVATAQPHIASVFHRLDLQSYIGTSYLLGSAAFMLLFSTVADVYGRHPSLQLSLLFFVIGSAISTGAQNIGMMLAGRGIAGIGAAGLTAVNRIILTDSRSLDDNSWQMIALMILYTVGYCVGPVIGGALTSVSFRWIFAINLPACVVASALIFLLLHNKTKKGQASSRLPGTTGTSEESWIDKLFRIDWIGTLFFTGAGILLLLALNWGSTDEWASAKVIVSFIVGGILLITCIVWEHVLSRARDAPVPPHSRVMWAEPLIPLQIFASYNVWAVLFSCFTQGMVIMVMFYFVAIFAIIVSGLSATDAGVQLIYFAPGLAAGSYISMIIVKLTRQPRWAINFGGVVTVIGLGLMSMGVDQNKQTLVNGFMVLTGIGVGAVFASVGVQIRFSQAEDRQAIVTTLTLFMRSFGGTVGLAQCGAVMNAKVASYISSIISSGILSATDQAALGSGQWTSSTSLSSLQAIDALPGNVQAIVRAAFTNGLRWSFISLVPWCAVSVLTTVFLTRIQEPQPNPATEELPLPKDEEAVDIGEEVLPEISMKPQEPSDVVVESKETV